MRDFH